VVNDTSLIAMIISPFLGYFLTILVSFFNVLLFYKLKIVTDGKAPFLVFWYTFVISIIGKIIG